ncbi:hypothetical protein SAMN05421755_10954 [Nitrosomonas sp. Nm33]|nr:hypothetical protein SAMN05421755_10954 [Nitrosomonas sp. Nm33]
MWFDSVIKVNKAAELNLPVDGVFKVGLVMPHLHQGADNMFSFAVGLGSIDLSEFLADAVRFAGFNESMAVSTFIFFAVIRISIIDLIRALGDNGFGEEPGGAIPGFIGQDGCMEFSGEVINCDKQVFPGLGG